MPIINTISKSKIDSRLREIIEFFSNHLVSNLIKNNGPEFIEKTYIKDEGKIIYHKFNISFPTTNNNSLKKWAVPKLLFWCSSFFTL